MGSIGGNMNDVSLGKACGGGMKDFRSMHVASAGRGGIGKFSTGEQGRAALDYDEDVREFLMKLGDSILAAKAEHGVVDAVFLQGIAGGAGGTCGFVLQGFGQFPEGLGSVVIDLLRMGLSATPQEQRPMAIIHFQFASRIESPHPLSQERYGSH
jgi:hypothetical protein